jgi:hypothetical protein
VPQAVARTSLVLVPHREVFGGHAYGCRAQVVVDGRGCAEWPSLEEKGLQILRVEWVKKKVVTSRFFRAIGGNRSAFQLN